MAKRKSPVGYFVSFAGIVGTQAAEKMLDSQEWWSSVQWGIGTLLFAAFGFGLVVQDIYNPQSEIRKTWRKWRRIFEVTQADTALVLDPHEYLAIRCRVKFLKALKAPNLVVRVSEHLFFETRTKIVHSEVLPDKEKDSELSLLLGSIPIMRPGWVPRHRVWGTELAGVTPKDGQIHIGSGVKNVVEIVINKQVYRIYVTTPLQTEPEHALAHVTREEDIPLFHL